jgi:ubiquinone/menaquinone biosynthesis C-methylase UbiE
MTESLRAAGAGQPQEPPAKRSPPSDEVEADPDPNAVYALGSSRGESQRLQRQADELAPESSALLDRVGLGPGATVLDLGCGPRGIIELLFERVSPGGRVVGVDADPAHVGMAKELASKLAPGDIEIVSADARHTGLQSGSFDLVHARTLLVTLPDPVEVVNEMVRLARAGGWVAGLEPDTEVAICYPPDPAVARLGEIFGLAFRRNGADPYIGRRMKELYTQAGLKDVVVEARAPVYPPGHSRRTIRADLVRAIRPQILSMGLADERELDDLDAAVRRRLNDPETVVMPHLIFLAWGRKPAAA